jgi:hypothetical protein
MHGETVKYQYTYYICVKFFIFNLIISTSANFSSFSASDYIQHYIFFEPPPALQKVINTKR